MGFTNTDIEQLANKINPKSNLLVPTFLYNTDVILLKNEYAAFLAANDVTVVRTAIMFDTLNYILFIEYISN